MRIPRETIFDQRWVPTIAYLKQLQCIVKYTLQIWNYTRTRIKPAYTSALDIFFSTRELRAFRALMLGPGPIPCVHKSFQPTNSQPAAASLHPGQLSAYTVREGKLGQTSEWQRILSNASAGNLILNKVILIENKGSSVPNQVCTGKCVCVCCWFAPARLSWIFPGAPLISMGLPEISRVTWQVCRFWPRFAGHYSVHVCTMFDPDICCPSKTGFYYTCVDMSWHVLL